MPNYVKAILIIYGVGVFGGVLVGLVFISTPSTPEERRRGARLALGAIFTSVVGLALWGIWHLIKLAELPWPRRRAGLPRAEVVKE